MNNNIPALEVLFTPAEYAALSNRDLSQTACVVFDIFRATSTIITALAHGAEAIVPVAEIPEALAIHQLNPEIVLAGERDGLRIGADLTGGIDFDLGNSPREFTPGRVRGKTIALSTTNGSRALRACEGAKAVLVGSFLNLAATAAFLQTYPADNLILVCSGTADHAAYEDVLGAGALAGLVWPAIEQDVADSANIARHIYEQSQHDLMSAVIHSRNGCRLLGIPELRGDVAWCLQRDIYPLVAKMEDGKVIRLSGKGIRSGSVQA
jgi:2-phosphosulfolactate phosphatase